MTAIVVLSTMGKPNPIHVLLLLLVTLASYVSAEHFYIVPNDSTSQCQNYSAGTCFTLEEFASNSSHLDQDNLTLSFLPGQHLLTRRLTIIGPQNIALTGQNSSNSLSTIKCQGTSGFEFGDIQSLDIEHLEFTGCGNVERGGAIFINRSDNVLIRGCHFTDNHVVGFASSGGAIHAENTTAMNIGESFFHNNFVVGLISGGGAISVFSGNINSTNDQYINNSAGYGGAISVSSGNINSTNDQYINNSADYGGAIIVSSGNITSTNVHYTNNSAGIGGGAIIVISGNINSTNDQYTNNSAGRDGGAIIVISGNINSTNDQYTNNSAGRDGGAIDVISGNINSTNDQYIDNSAGHNGGALAIYVYFGNITSAGRDGGAIDVISGNINSTNDQYINNSAGHNGGALAIYVYFDNIPSADRDGAIDVISGNINSTNDQYINNSAGYGGAISVSSGNINSTNDQYINNSADYGGAIIVSSGNITSTNVHYTNNSAGIGGGAIIVISGNINSTNDQYTNNSAGRDGGAIDVISGNINSTNDQYINNSAGRDGGAIDVNSANISSTNGHYINNSAGRGGAISVYGYGGAISVISGNINSTNDHYINNSADRGGAISVYFGDITKLSGGAIYASGDDTKLSGANFEHNSAGEGAVIYQNRGALVIGQSNITNNFASNKNTVYINSGKLSLSERVNFMNNNGSLYVFNTQVEFKGTVIFINNFGDYGGAITAFLSEISFNTASTVTIFNNTATNGGGMSLIQSNMHVYHSIELTDNHATDFGGGIYAYQSVIEFNPEQRSEITKNTASNGGAVCAIASNILISNTHVEVSSNIAKVNGGGIYLEQNSKIYVQKYEREDHDTGLKVRLDFTSNSAEKGGAIFVADNTNDGVICQEANTKIYQTECFIQTLGLQGNIYFYKTNLINILFSNNTARQSGSDIYGGLLDRCTINQNAEVVQLYPEFKNSSGFDYVKTTTQIEQITDYNKYYNYTPDYFIEKISRSDVNGLISSDAVRVEFCLNNVISPNYSHPNVSIKKGEMFTVSLVAVDQVGNPLNATIISSFQSKSGNGRFKAGQVEQQVGDQCTELEYNVYSQDNSAQTHIHADGPCGDKGVSRKTLNVIFLPCTCPVGFEPSLGPTEIDCICECDQTLQQHQITSCSSENETILVETNIWIGLSSYSNETGFVIHDCPFDYCVEKPVNISLSSPDSADEQCAYNRTGNLCGMCQEDLSLVFGSSRCQECSNNYISLLIPFALTGIALVAFILLLNLTVATGTIHGLIFYANILTANHSMFLPPSTSSFLTVFISLLNLDLGIETCFYNGMDSYGKFLLQLAFPTYLFVLIGTIIALCEVSKKFTSLLSNRNPVAALCTLILLSYSKLIRTIITALQFTHLDYPDGSREIVWLYDANVPYFTVSHIPRFIAAFIIIILGAIYTILLLFGKWFSRCSNRKIMKWTKNTKYNAFIDAYHAPFTPKHRYWFGLLLFAQIIHNLVTAIATGPVPILSAGCVALGLIMLKLLNTRIYKNRLQDSLETLFLTNIVVLAIATFYIRETNEDQLALANTSMAISFILFLIILGYHFYKYILKGTRVWARVTKPFQGTKQATNRLQIFKLAQVKNKAKPVDQDPPDADNQLREPALDILDPVYTEDYRVTPPPPVIHKPPKITYTVIDAIP